MTPLRVVFRGHPEVRWSPREFPFTPEQRELVDRIWARETALRGDQLHDGELLAHVADTATGADGAFVRYRYFFAQRAQPGLELGVRPIGVAGVTVQSIDGEDHVLAGRRSASVSLYPGCLELPPSGCIDRRAAEESGAIACRRMILAELYEETHIQEQQVVSVTPFALVFDNESRIYDCCLEIRVRDGTSGADTSEYGALSWIPVRQLNAYLTERDAEMVPGSAAIGREWLAAREERG